MPITTEVNNFLGKNAAINLQTYEWLGQGYNTYADVTWIKKNIVNKLE